MAVFPSFKLTKKGEELLNRCIGEGKVLTFTKIKIGDGVPVQDWRELSDIQSSFKEFPVLETSVQKDQVLRIKAYFDNKGFLEDKKFKEIGVFVKLEGLEGEFLYSYTNAGDTGDIIPAENRGFFSRTLDIANYIGYATNITFNIEQTRNDYDFNTEAEVKVATFLKAGDRIRLWGRLVQGDIQVRNGIVTSSNTSLTIDNGLFVQLTGEITVNTIEDLKNLKGATEGTIVEVLGYYGKGDGANHKRIISQTDDGSGVQLTNGLWANIVHSGEVNVSWFGAKGDGATDDTMAIQRAVKYLSPFQESYSNMSSLNEAKKKMNGGTVIISGTVKTTDTLFVPSNVKIISRTNGAYFDTSSSGCIYYVGSGIAIANLTYKKTQQNSYTIMRELPTIWSDNIFSECVEACGGAFLSLNIKTSLDCQVGYYCVGAGVSSLNLSIGSYNLYPQCALFMSRSWGTRHINLRTISSKLGAFFGYALGGSVIDGAYINKAGDVNNTGMFMQDYNTNTGILATADLSTFEMRNITTEHWNRPYTLCNVNGLTLRKPHMEGSNIINSFTLLYTKYLEGGINIENAGNIQYNYTKYPEGSIFLLDGAEGANSSVTITDLKIATATKNLTTRKNNNKTQIYIENATPDFFAYGATKSLEGIHFDYRTVKNLEGLTINVMDEGNQDNYGLTINTATTLERGLKMQLKTGLPIYFCGATTLAGDVVGRNIIFNSSSSVTLKGKINITDSVVTLNSCNVEQIDGSSFLTKGKSKLIFNNCRLNLKYITETTQTDYTDLTIIVQNNTEITPVLERCVNGSAFSFLTFMLKTKNAQTVTENNLAWNSKIKDYILIK